MAGESEEHDDKDDVFSRFLAFPEEASTKRSVCERCRCLEDWSPGHFSCIFLSVCKYRRPTSVCICSCFPATPIAIQTRIIVLQHPHEVYDSFSPNKKSTRHFTLQETRSLATVPLLQQCIPSENITIVHGKRFGPQKYYLIINMLKNVRTFCAEVRYWTRPCALVRQSSFTLEKMVTSLLSLYIFPTSSL